MSRTLEDLSALDRLFLLLYGPPKSGKTVTAHGMPRTRTLDFDDGMQAVLWAITEGIIKKELRDVVFETIRPQVNAKKGKNVFDQATDQIDEWIREEDILTADWDKPYDQFWDTLIIDSATFLTEGSIIKGLKENKKLGISKSWERYGGKLGDVRPMRKQDWGSAGQLFWNFMEMTVTLGKNVIVLCHEYHNTNDDGSIISIDPLVTGQLRQKLPALFDEVWYQVVKGNVQNPKYQIQTKPDTKRNLGSRLGCLDPVETADFDALKAKIAEFYGIKPETLWTAYHGEEGRNRAEEEAGEVEGASI